MRRCSGQRAKVSINAALGPGVFLLRFFHGLRQRFNGPLQRGNVRHRCLVLSTDHFEDFKRKIKNPKDSGDCVNNILESEWVHWWRKRQFGNAAIWDALPGWEPRPPRLPLLSRN